MKRYKTLEDFLEFYCGMAPPRLVEHYESHREWIESCLEDYKDIEDLDDYEDTVESLWLTIPEMPHDFFYRG